MSTGPNQILIKRSDVAGVVPSGLSFGEPAINSSDGVLFFSQQTDGSATNDLWEFRGFTNEGFVKSVNGATGAIKAVSSVGISNSTGFSDISGIAFASTTAGLTFSITQHGDTAAVSIDADSLRSSLGQMSYTFTTITGALNAPNATSNGQFIFNTDTNRLSIFKLGSDGVDNRSTLVEANSLGSGQIQFRVDSSTSSQTFIMFYDNEALNYDGTNFDLEIYAQVPDDIGSVIGSGKPIVVTIVPDGGQVNASKHFRLPDGNTFGTVVTSFNGETGDILTSDDHLHVAGLSCDGGATFASDVIITSDSGDIALTIKADTDNNNENDNPIIRLEEDGGSSSTDIGLAGSNNHPFTGALANAFYIRPTNDTSHFQKIQFATDSNARVTIDNTGNVGINTTAPVEKLDVDGIIRARQGITAAGATFSGQVNLLDNEVIRPKFKDYAETVNAGGSKNASFNVDFEDGNVQTFTFADDLTVSFTNPPATGIAGTVTLIITNGGANTTTWNSAVKWPGDNAPALTSSGVDIVTFTTIDAGTTIYGFVGGINFS